MKKLILIAATLLFALSARASSYSITINGTINSSSTASGYSVGDAFSFTITLTSTFVTIAGTNFDCSANYAGESKKVFNEWGCYSSLQPALLESISFTGSTGTYVSDYSYDDLQFLKWNEGASVTTDLFLMVLATPNGTSSTLAVGSNKVTYIDCEAAFSGYDTLNGFGSETNVYTFFTDNSDTYTASTFAGDGTHIVLADSTTIVFTPTSIVITSSVPEPATDAALAGLGALGAVAFFRRRRK